MRFAGSQKLATVLPSEVSHLINSIDLKSSPTDTFPSALIKQCSGSFSVIIANLANLSFSQGNFPTAFKTAQITPLLKKPDLDPLYLSHYHPICNLPTVSELLEHIALTRLTPHLLSSGNLNPFQSAYRKLHSTETALLKSLSDFFGAIDAGQSVLAVSLDLSAAFDTVSHDKLLTRLEHSFGIAGTALSWTKSYIYCRSQFVCLDGKKSVPNPLSWCTSRVCSWSCSLFSLYCTNLFSHLFFWNLFSF